MYPYITKYIVYDKNDKQISFNYLFSYCKKNKGIIGVVKGYDNSRGKWVTMSEFYSFF